MDERVKKYIEDRSFNKNNVPICQYEINDVDRFGCLLKNKPLRCWILKNGAIEDYPLIKLKGYNYIAFTFDEETGRMLVDIQWEFLGGEGYDIVFDKNGKIVSESMRWIS